MIAMMLESTGVMVRACVAMYKAVAQSVLLYDSKSWMVTVGILKVLAEFHHRAARWITGMTAQREADREWEYPKVEEAMDYAGLDPIRLYIKRRQTTISEMVACRPVYALCTEAESMPGKIRMVRWWYQYAVNNPEV